MLWPFALLYTIAGAVTALVTMRVFPPMEGFRPKLWLLFVAFTVFMVFWPVLVLLAIWYHLTSIPQQASSMEVRSEEQQAPTVTSGVQATKPR